MSGVISIGILSARLLPHGREHKRHILLVVGRESSKEFLHERSKLCDIGASDQFRARNSK